MENVNQKPEKNPKNVPENPDNEENVLDKGKNILIEKFDGELAEIYSKGSVGNGQ